MRERGRRTRDASALKRLSMTPGWARRVAAEGVSHICPRGDSRRDEGLGRAGKYGAPGKSSFAALRMTVVKGEVENDWLRQ